MTGQNSNKSFDAIIIGTGQAGAPLAEFLAGKGKSVAIIEKHFVGGSCINYGCTPSKSMIASAKISYFINRAKDYGIRTSKPKIDMPKVIKRKKKIVESFRNRKEKRLIENKNITLIKGIASFVDQRNISITLNEGVTQNISTEKIFINTGGRPAIPSIQGIEKIDYLTSTSILELKEVPDHLLILGGGYIGLEFGQMFRRFGSEVTIIDHNDQLLKREDKDIADEIKKIFEEDGINVLLNKNVEKIEETGKGKIRLILKGKEKITGTHLLIAAGHVPNTNELNLSAAGIETDEKGYIKVNDKLETNVQGIYALGDVKGGPAFTHISYDDFRIIRDNLDNPNSASINGRFIPYVVFIDPQLGRIGLNEKEAKRSGKNILVGKIPMSYIARAIEVDETRGLMKVIVDADTEEILGCSILGIEGGELMAMIQIAMMGKLKYTALKEKIFTHPTLAESLNTLFCNLGKM